MADKITTVPIPNAELFSHNLSDLLCWWEGFKFGLKISGTDHFIVAEYGIEAIRKLNEQVKAEIQRQNPNNI